MTEPTPLRPVRYDAQALENELLRNFDEFQESFQNETARRAVGRDGLAALRQRIDRLRRRLASDFKLVVLGDFKRGKSTLINALLKDDVVTTDVTPETVTINHVTWGPAFSAEACFEDGGRVSLSRDELHSERLTRILHTMPEAPDHILIRHPTESLRGVHLVDTPGMGDLLKQYDAQVQRYLPEADAVIYVISALSPLSETERLFLQSHLRPQAFPRIVFVVTMLDSLPTSSDAEKVLDLVKDKVHRSFPGAQVFGVSALDEFCRVRGLERPQPERAAELEAAFDLLRGHIELSILLHRDMIRLSRGVSLGVNALEYELLQLRRIRTALSSEQQQVDAAIAEREDQNSVLHERIRDEKLKVRRAIEALAHESVNWMDGFLDRLKSDAIADLADVPYGGVQRHFSFFLSDRIRDAVTRCLDAHQPVILSHLKQTDQAVEALLASGGAPSLERSVSSASLEVGKWTFIDNFFLLGMAGFFVRLAFVTTLGRLVVGFLDKNLGVQNRSGLFRQQVEAAFPEMRSSAAAEIHTLYQGIARKVDQELDTWYRAEIDAALAALRQAQDIRAAMARDGQPIDQELAALIEVTESHLADLAGFKERVSRVDFTEALA